VNGKPPVHGLTEAQHEEMRKKVALEMLQDPELKQRVEEMIGEKQARIRYPEAYEE